MLNHFYDNNKVLLTGCGFLATICGLFLSISTPQIDEARTSLGYVQSFWLILFIFCLILVFIQFGKSFYRQEKQLGKRHDFQTAGVLTFALGCLLFWVILNLLQYGIYTYTGFLSFLGVSLYIIMTAGVPAFLMLWVENKKEIFSLPSAIIIYSFSLSVLITSMFTTLELTVLGNIPFYWAGYILSISFLVILIILLLSRVLKKTPALK